MSAWITIVAEDLNDYQVAKIIAAARTKALAAGQADPFLAVMPDVINRMRDDIRGCVSNVVSATPLTIPQGLRSEAIYLIIESMQARLPGISLTDELKTLISDAKKRLVRISKCEVPIEIPDDPETTPEVQRSGGLAEGINVPPRTVTKDTVSHL
jgi:hypothetical protein